MADIDLKTETPDTSLPTTGFLFGADSQAAASPSVFTVQSVATTLLGSTTLTGATVTTSSPVIDAAQTWNASGVTFTGLRFNAAGTSDANSAAASLLMDLQVNTASRFNVSKAGRISGATGVYAPYVDLGGPTNGPVQIGRVDNGNILGIGYGNTGALTLRSDAAFGWSNSSTVTGSSLDPATVLTRRAAANLRLGAADTSASATITVTIAAPGVVTWSDHSLSTGSPVIFTTTGALPTGITADTTYYAIVVGANTFQLASSFANALAGTAITTSGSQSGTHTGRRGAIAQQFGPQDTLSTGSLGNIDGADFVIRGSRSIGNKPGGSIIFQVAPAGSSGTAQNALATALTINSDRSVTIAAGASGSLILSDVRNTRIFRTGDSTSSISFETHGSAVPLIIGGDNSVSLATAAFLGWGGIAFQDVRLFRDAANTLALRNGTNAQTFNVYKTYTDASNNSGIQINVGAANANFAIIQTFANGTGTLTGGLSFKASVGAIILNTGNTDRWSVNSSGHLVASADNTYDIGTNATTARPRSIFVGTSLTLGDGANIVAQSTTGTKIGTATTQKIGFYNATPVVQPTAVADATDNATAITQLNALLSRMRDLGLIAT